MKTDDLGLECLPQEQSGQREKRTKMWGRLGRQLGTTSRAVSPAAGLTWTCCGELGTPLSQRGGPEAKECGADRPACDNKVFAPQGMNPDQLR